MPVTGNLNALATGPGFLFWAPLGSTEPTDLATAWDAAWLPWGHTDEGFSFSYGPEFESIRVAELLDPAKVVATGRTITAAVAAAQISATNVKRVLNGGTVTTTGVGAAAVHSYEPPGLDAQVRCMLGWEADDATERMVLRQCIQTGTVEVARRPGATKAVLPATFTLESPATGSKPFKWLFKGADRA